MTERDILLVDADDEARDVMSPFLARCGHVRVARTLAEARSALASHAPEVLVLDPELPDGDGLGLMAEARARRPGSQSLVAFGSRWGARTSEIIAAGAADVVSKPFDIGTLPRRIARLQTAARILHEEIARRHELEARLRHAERVTALGTAAATMAHEVANPLTTIVANASYLREAFTTDVRDSTESRAELLRAAEGIGRAASMIEVFITRVRKFAGRKEQERRVGPLSEVVEWTLVLLGQRIAESGVRLVAPAGSVPVLAHDPVRVTQALLNALTNAIEAASPGGTISIAYAEAGAHAGLIVEDDGPAVTDDVLTRMGEPFFSTKPTGTGLGLAVMHEVMSEHGGRVEIARGPGGRGVRVALWLPR